MSPSRGSFNDYEVVTYPEMCTNLPLLLSSGTETKTYLDRDETAVSSKSSVFVASILTLHLLFYPMSGIV